MKLHDFKPAPNPRRVRMYLAEKGVEIPTVQIDIAGGQHLTDAYRQVNPHCMVPALELDDGTVITQSLAICTYIETMHPTPPLMGETAEEKAMVMMWYQHIELGGMNAVTEYLRNSNERFSNRALVGPTNYEQLPVLAERGQKRIEEFMALLNNRLAASPYVAGNRFTLADIAGYIVMDFARRAADFAPPDDAEALVRWYGEMAGRPSAEA